MIFRHFYQHLTSLSPVFPLSLKLILILPVSLFSNAAQAQAGPYKISGSMGDFQDVTEFKISPDGTQVVFIADKTTDNDFELYSVLIAGGSVTRLNGSLVAGGNIQNFKISPDSLRVIYGADQDTVNQIELYSVPIEGGVSTKLNDALVSDGNVLGSYTISADSSKVVFLADQVQDDEFELYSVDIGGGSPTKLNPQLVAGGSVTHHLISETSNNVVYRADQEVDDIYQLYSVPISGGGTIDLGNSSIVDMDGDFKISNDGAFVIFRRPENLFSTPIGGGTPIILNPTLVVNGAIIDFKITPNSQKVIYRAFQNTDGVSEIFATNIDSEDSVRVNASLTSGGDVIKYSISPDSKYVVYRADQQQNSVFQYYSTDLNSLAQPPIMLSEGLGVTYLAQITNNSKNVIYSQRGSNDNIYYLKSIAITGGRTFNIGASALNTFILKFFANDDGSNVIFMEGSSIGPGRTIKVSERGSFQNAEITRLLFPQSIQDFQYHSNSQTIVYLADEKQTNKFELFAVTAPFFDDTMCFPIGKKGSLTVVCL